MPHLLSTKLDSTLRYFGGFYGLATSVLSQISTAVSEAATAKTSATAAQTAAVTAQTSLTAHVGAGNEAHVSASGITAGFMSPAHYTRLQGVEDGAQVVSEARVRAALAVATAAISVHGQQLRGLAEPTLAADAATKQYVDAVASGLDCKESVRVVDTVGVELSGVQTVDGVVLADGDRVLRAVGVSATNGLYTVNVGGAWPRAADASTTSEVTSGLFTFVTEGTAYADSGWVLVTNDPIAHLGSTPLQFTQFSGAGDIVAGAGLSKAGNTIAIGVPADASIVLDADSVRVGVISDSQHGTRGGDTAHAVASASAAGFMTAAQFSKLASLAAGEASTLGRVTVDAVHEMHGNVPYAATVILDTSAHNDFKIEEVAGNITIQFSNLATGRQGMIAFRQDATGGRSVTFSSPGNAIYRDAGTTNLQPAQGPNAITLYTYCLVLFGGAKMLFIGKLTPVTA
jgi:hypothetical protein